ncbi:MAG TPA: HlyD family efflux transporter periplasmic adaptor subunit [Pirellulaceae bacterium]|nr:HlyD family efflux transporter periplasmic adaptor subunit [Pirellulaceae bacterium]
MPSRPIETTAATNAWEGYITPVRRIQVPAPDTGLLRQAETAPGREVQSGELLARLDRSRQEREQELAATELQLAELKLADEAQRRLDYAAALRSELETATPARTADAPDQVESRRIARLLLVPPREPLERERLETRRREAEYEVALRKLALDGARAEVARGEIVAPFAGVVTQRYRQAGEWVEAGSPVCELVAMDRLQAEVAVPIADPALVDLVGRACRLRIETAGGGKFEVAATIARVGELVGANGRVAVVAEFDNPKVDGRRAVLPGSRVRLELGPASEAPSN